MQFLNRLNYWLSQNNRFEKKEILVILDNWSIHKTVEVVQKILEINWNVIFLPAYTPQFSQIEMWFSKIKWNLRQLYSRKIVKLSLKSSNNDVFNTMKHIIEINLKQLKWRGVWGTISFWQLLISIGAFNSLRDFTL